MPARHLVIISHDVVQRLLAGPGIRALEMGRLIAETLPVTLAVPNAVETEMDGPLRLVSYQPGQWESLRAVVEGADTLLAQPFSLLEFPQLVALDKPLAIDLYDPFPLENLQHWQHAAPDERQRVQAHDLNLLRTAIQRGDFFLCANRRQSDAWLGALMLAGRVNPQTVDADPTLDSLIAEVPFGLPDAPFVPQGQGPRHHFPSLRAEDRIILWGGGLWDWLDPLTAIRAMPALLDEIPTARLLFPGTRHPNPVVPFMRRTQEAMALAETMGLAGREVLFGDWVAYEDWPAYLAESEVALSLHHDTLETRLAAVRSRVLGYIWAGIPMVANEGDAASDLIMQHGIGEVVPMDDAAATAAALARVLRRGRAPYAAAFDALRPQLAWSRTSEPLLRFARAARRAGDAAGGAIPYCPPTPTPVAEAPALPAPPLRRLLDRLRLRA